MKHLKKLECFIDRIFSRCLIIAGAFFHSAINFLRFPRLRESRSVRAEVWLAAIVTVLLVPDVSYQTIAPPARRGEVKVDGIAIEHNNSESSKTR